LIQFLHECHDCWQNLRVFAVLELISFVILLNANEPAMVYGFAAVFGLGFGFAFVSATTVIANYYGPEAYAVLFGVGALIGTLCAGLAPILSGLSFDKLGTYHPALYSYVAVGSVIIVLIAMTRPPQPAEAQEPIET